MRSVHSLLFFQIASATAYITCLKIGDQATATWVNAEKESCTWVGKVGSNFGFNPVNNGSYGCNGRCGPSCDGDRWDGDPYTQHCFSHDICSYFNNATGGLLDPNCGAAFEVAIPDFLGGYEAGCHQDNPDLPAVPPTERPVCKPAEHHEIKKW